MCTYLKIIFFMAAILLPNVFAVRDSHAATETCLIVFDNSSTAWHGCDDDVSVLLIQTPAPCALPQTHDLMPVYWSISQKNLAATLAYFTDRERLEIDAFLWLQEKSASSYSLIVPCLQLQTKAHTTIVAELFSESEDKQQLFLKTSLNQKVQISNFTHIKFQGYPLIPVPIF